MSGTLLASLAPADHAADEPDVMEDAGSRRAAARFREFMEALGPHLRDPNLSGTAWRVARMFRELLAGLP